MTDPRVSKLAQVLVNYSLNLQPGEEFSIVTTSMADELTLEVHKEAIQAGAHVFINYLLPEATENLFKYGSDTQLEYISPIQRLITENFSARLLIRAPKNTRYLSSIDPARIAISQKAIKDLFATQIARRASGDYKTCITDFPTNSGAQEADMSLNDYEDFVYSAGLLDKADPAAAWQEEAKHQQTLIEWLAGKENVVLKGENIDLNFSIKDRKFVECAGKVNFPDGEIFTGPVEDSINGWVRYSYPALYNGREVTDIQLWFEGGKVVKEKASKGEESLTTFLNTDDGSRYLGEWGIGTNYNIQQFTKNMLFDEKMGGTIHFALGTGFPETGSKNKSGIHWDMLCDMADSEITIDGDLFYKDGKFTV